MSKHVHCTTCLCVGRLTFWGGGGSLLLFPPSSILHPSTSSIFLPCSYPLLSLLYPFSSSIILLILHYPSSSGTFPRSPVLHTFSSSCRRKFQHTPWEMTLPKMRFYSICLFQRKVTKGKGSVWDQLCSNHSTENRTVKSIFRREGLRCISIWVFLGLGSSTNGSELVERSRFFFLKKLVIGGIAKHLTSRSPIKEI